MKVIIIIAFKGFKDQEYFETRRVLESAGHQIQVASNQTGLAQGVDGGEVVVDLTIDQVKDGDYQALILIGGAGALKYLDNATLYDLLQRSSSQKGMVLAAICIAPLILARAVNFKGREMTVWSSTLDRSAVKELKNRGVVYLNQPVVASDRLITADGPEAAELFGQAIIKALDKIGK